MNTESDKQERGRLQHAAEHERPRRRGSVLIYLVILFAAFLLLLMSFLMQRRANQEAIDNLQQTSESAVQSLENLLQENEALKEQNGALQTQLDELQGQLDGAAQAGQEELDALQAQVDALTYLNQIRALYNDHRNADARDVAAAAEAALADRGGMEGVLGEISAALTQEERENYDPLEAYRSLSEWLN